MRNQNVLHMTARLLVIGIVITALGWSMSTATVAQAEPMYIGCSVSNLISAINAANSTPTPDTLELKWGCTYTLIAVDNDDAATGGANGLPVISTEMTLNGNRATIERDASAPAFRIMYNTALLRLNDITIRGGAVAGGHENGGGVDAQSTLIVNDSTFEGNSATWSGGGVNAAGPNKTHSFTNVTFRDNSAAIGGGVFNGSDTVTTYSGVTLYENSAGSGAGMFSDWNAVTNLGNVTFDENDGTAVETQETATVNLSNVTIANNTGAGVDLWGPATINLKNTILDNNGGGNCVGSMVNGGNNLDSDGSCGVGPATDPKLDPIGLNDNGGPTMTIGLLPNSPALNAGNAGVCNTAPVNKVDQRLVKRPQGAQCDIGALEAGADVSIHKQGTAKHKNITFTLVVRNHGAIPAKKVKVTDPLAASLTFVSWQTTQGVCAFTAPNHSVTCKLGVVNVGVDVTITIKAKAANGTQSVHNEAKVTSKTFDLNMGNNISLSDVQLK